MDYFAFFFKKKKLRSQILDAQSKEHQITLKTAYILQNIAKTEKMCIE